MAKSIQKSSKNRWILRWDIEKNRWRNVLKKQVFFNIDFSSIVRRFWPPFGRPWGGFGDHLAVQNGARKDNIELFDKIAIFKGFGEGLGRFLGGISLTIPPFRRPSLTIPPFHRSPLTIPPFRRPSLTIPPFRRPFLIIPPFHRSPLIVPFCIFLTSQAKPSHVSHFLAWGCMLQQL